ncbi:uncharacterized protein LOC104453333 isoform X3 [Eucalyptus grandis]|uniref:uncharacterized protein LOC104453333 isoform X3 n=1 Tax=Eucalyptus grandis TaxID=71139 RepID=UPI0008A0B451|nr:uncharacterized protein LOC104453333 isoform X3 [Eucalyptus grandis]
MPLRLPLATCTLLSPSFLCAVPLLANPNTDVLSRFGLPLRERRSLYSLFLSFLHEAPPAPERRRPRRHRLPSSPSQAPSIGGPLATPVRPKLHAFVQYESINVAEKTAKPSQAWGRRDMMEKNPGKKKMLLYLSNDQSNNLRSLLSNLMLTSRGIWGRAELVCGQQQ